MKRKKTLALLSATILTAVTLTGCSSESEHGLAITAIAPYVSYEKAEEYSQTLTVGEDNLPVLLTTEMMTAPSEETEETEVADSYEESMDSVNQNAAEMMGAAGMMKVTAQIAGNEVDIIISDYENGQRLSESFLPLDELFTTEELAEIDTDLLVSYEELDDENNPTGNILPPTGIDVTSMEEYTDFMSGEQLVIHVVSNTENLEVTKDYMLSLPVLE